MLNLYVQCNLVQHRGAAPKAKTTAIQDLDEKMSKFDFLMQKNILK